MSIEDHRGPHPVERTEDVVMRTRDGVRLVADIYRPIWPVIPRLDGTQ